MQSIPAKYFLLSFLFFACSSSRGNLTGSLNSDERQKLDPQLYFLFENSSGGPASLDLDIIQREEGGTVVGVDVYTSDPGIMEELGIKNYVAGQGTVACYVDPASLRKILHGKSVTKVVARKGKLPAK